MRCGGAWALVFFYSSRRRHTICALVTGVQTCALPIYPDRDYAYPPCVSALGSQRKARIRISIIPIGICPASSQESAVQSVETMEQDGRQTHARPHRRQKSRCCRGLLVPLPRWLNLATGYSIGTAHVCTSVPKAHPGCSFL